MNQLIAECLITFGVGLAGAASLAIPAAIELIRGRDMAGYVAISAFALGVVCVIAGAMLL